jgi:hypothetical protein
MSWRISVRQIGYDIGREGMQDAEIIPLLHQLSRPTFFTLDDDYYRRDLCHRRYCLIYLAVPQHEVAWFVRRLLKHVQFNTQAKRLGTVIRASRSGLSVWRLNAEDYDEVSWSD